MRRYLLIATALVPTALVPAAGHAETATLMAYSDGPFQDNYTAAVTVPYNAKGGANQVTFFGSNSSATMLGQLRTQKTAPQVDVVIMDTAIAAIACAEGLIEKITPAMLPVMSELDPNAQDANGCGPGVTFDHLIVAYDAKAVIPAPTSLSILADPKWKGRTSLAAPPNIQALALTAILANANGGDWRKPDAAIGVLKTMAPNVQTFDPQPDGYTLILNGTLDFATGWNARAQLFKDRSGGRLGVMVPKEGTALQINTINLVKGGPHPEAGLAFMKYALSAEAQKAFTERMFYGPTNMTATIAPEAAARTSAGADVKPLVVPVDWNEMVKLRDGWTQRWRREVIPAGAR